MFFAPDRTSVTWLTHDKLGEELGVLDLVRTLKNLRKLERQEQTIEELGQLWTFFDETAQESFESMSHELTHLTSNIFLE